MPTPPPHLIERLAARATPVPAAAAAARPPVDMAAMEQAGLVVGHRQRTRIAEEYRIAVGELLRVTQPDAVAGNVTMITSARPGEGKSFTALNLAGSIAQHAQREVILVDVDAKQRSLSAELGLADRPGLLDLARDTTLPLDDLFHRTAVPNLSFVPIGRGQDSTIDAPPGTPIAALVARIARRHPRTMVLIDAPPCLSTSDPSTLAPHVGQILMVVQAESTQRNEIAAALDLVRACSSVTLLLNKIRLTTSYTFGAYQYFGAYS